ncbi:C2H2-type zinc finger protein [Kluyveromyces lactis]|uniref:KLLA0F26961p n=1 Tax=Kluyveromyces lactis (strain ATCC 8585 / CBS 2359 / DSM 70799 / NBRC 1267 / NRRL Y-1140 / WM37) TaxID=284590 RepID=Q6CIG0_KLULA|nr:uncharacterized protein KLLA0_F26961g [Kluyveromyces lactis]CAG98987.1 KLLA0F26961p [Kluyveromyces lactis]|eukprot:XP_456279.1 uncharacterized protein KLLA0_F26961g [Kluyveromyces lactis]
MALGRYESGNRGSYTSENSLDIRNDSVSTNYGDKVATEPTLGYTRRNESTGSTPPAVRNVKRETLQNNMGSTPTELNDFLAMLDDKTTYSEVVQSAEPRLGFEDRQKSTEYHTGSELSGNSNGIALSGSPVDSYPNSQKISNHSSRNNTLNYSPNIEPSVMSVGTLSPQVADISSRKNSTVGNSLNSNSIQEFLNQIDLSHSEEQYINPYLLNKESYSTNNNTNNGHNSFEVTHSDSLFMDSGADAEAEDHGELNQLNENPLLLDDVTVSPNPTSDDRRRMSEVVNGNIAYPAHSRGSISHQVDFWNLGSGNPISSNQNQSSNSQVQQDNNSELFDLMSFKNKGRQHLQQQLQQQQQQAQLQSQMHRQQIQQRQQHQQQQSQQRHSAFKIDNELTQLLNAYNMTQSNLPSNGSNINTNKLRTGSFTQSNVKRSNSSNQEAHNRVGKQRYSMSLLDGNQDVISKLYGDMTRNGLSWENAIISDDEEDPEDHEDALRLRRKSALNRSTQVASQNPTETSSSGRFISPQLLNNDPLLETQISTSQTSLGLDRAGLNFKLNLPITNPEALIGSSQPDVQTLNVYSESNVLPTSAQSTTTKKKRSSMSKSKGPKSTSPMDEEEKPFKCDQCNKTFRRSEHLKRHVRSVHSTERPFHCQFCDKKFSRSDNLSQHLKTHKKHGDITELPPPRRVTNSSNKH